MGYTLTLDPDSMTRSSITKSLLGSCHHRRTLTEPVMLWMKFFKWSCKISPMKSHKPSRKIPAISRCDLSSQLHVFNDVTSIITPSVRQPATIMSTICCASCPETLKCPAAGWLANIVHFAGVDVALRPPSTGRPECYVRARNLKSFIHFKVNGSCMRGF